MSSDTSGGMCGVGGDLTGRRPDLVLCDCGILSKSSNKSCVGRIRDFTTIAGTDRDAVNMSQYQEYQESRMPHPTFAASNATNTGQSGSK